jgi:hypothetical protein
MLIEASKLFSWAKRDRERGTSFFGEKCRYWRTKIVHDKKDRFDSTAGTDAESQTSKPVWTPWLWTK